MLGLGLGLGLGLHDQYTYYGRYMMLLQFLPEYK